MTKELVDYRALMIKYMAHVADMEGTTYVHSLSSGTLKFTREERLTIEALDREAEKRT